MAGTSFGPSNPIERAAAEIAETVQQADSFRGASFGADFRQAAIEVAQFRSEETHGAFSMPLPGGAVSVGNSSYRDSTGRVVQSRGYDVHTPVGTFGGSSYTESREVPPDPRYSQERRPELMAPEERRGDQRVHLSERERVELAQAALNRAGAEPQLVEDGKPGPRTEAAIRQFQAAQRPPLPATGRLDRETLAALGVPPREERPQAPIAGERYDERRYVGGVSHGAPNYKPVWGEGEGSPAANGYRGHGSLGYKDRYGEWEDSPAANGYRGHGSLGYKDRYGEWERSPGANGYRGHGSLGYKGRFGEWEDSPGANGHRGHGSLGYKRRYGER